MSNAPNNESSTRVNRKPAGRGRVTIKTVASTAGVSVATVSLILSGRPDRLAQFNRDTIRRVREIAEQLGYRANLFACGLPTKTVPFYALVLQDLGRTAPEDWHTKAFESELLNGAFSAGIAGELLPILASSQLQSDPEKLRWLERVIDSGVCGVIARSPDAAMEKTLRQCMRQGSRVVVVAPSHVSRWPANGIAADDEATGRLAGRLLANQGCRRWAVVEYAGRTPSESHQLRRKGFEAAAMRASATTRVVKAEPGTDALTLGQALTRGRFDGIYAIDSALSVQTYLQLERAGCRAGADVAMVGTDSHACQADLGTRITSVGINWRELGELAVQKLRELVRQHHLQFETMYVSPTIQVGTTCVGPRPAPQIVDERTPADHRRLVAASQ